MSWVRYGQHIKFEYISYPYQDHNLVLASMQLRVKQYGTNSLDAWTFLCCHLIGIVTNQQPIGSEPITHVRCSMFTLPITFCHAGVQLTVEGLYIRLNVSECVLTAYVLTY